MIYLSYISHTYATKNKLEEAVFELLKMNDRVFIKDEPFLVQLIAEIKNEIDNLNFKYARCLPIKIDFEPVTNYPSNVIDYLVRWNNYPDSNGRHLCEFKLLASNQIKKL